MMRFDCFKLVMAIGVAALGAPMTTGCGSDCHDDESCAESSGGASSSAHGGAGGDGVGATGGSAVAQAYCLCVFQNCHDAYHDKWGEDEVLSRDACIAEADELPSTGMDETSGNSIECREHFCGLAESDEAQCAAALGNETCQ